jgi:Flp pilus assembly protein TadD
MRHLFSAYILKVVMNGSDTSNPDALSQRGLELLAEGKAIEAAREFRGAIAADESHVEAHHGLVRALRDAGRFEDAIGAALKLTVLTPHDPLAHTALSISLQQAGHVPEAEAAAARARVLEWKIALQTPPEEGEKL